MFPVVPISPGQLLDVRPEDLLDGGLFRTCDTYRGGGGYDQFPRLAAAHGLGEGHRKQFVVQLYGCTLDCPYCYVTREGVWGTMTSLNSSMLVKAFNETDATVFHLMGGAPALYMPRWPELLARLEMEGRAEWVFHSDLILNEGRPYNLALLKAITNPRALYAVDIKGWSPDEYARNTRRPGDPFLMMENLRRLEAQGVPFYITFTGVSQVHQIRFWETYAKEFPETVSLRVAESFSIEILEYDAQPHVDDVPWGGKPTGVQ